MATCNECLHRGPCGAKGGILKDFSTGNLRQDVEIRCGHFKNKSQYVEVVRCKDCRMFVDDKSALITYCTRERKNLTVKMDDFCNYGERRPFK
jgi:hypothetical protein